MNPSLLLVVGVIYAIIFWGVCSKKWWIALTLIIASSPFQNDISGGGPVKFSLAEVNLLLALPIVFTQSKKIKLGPTIFPAVFYLLVCIASAAMHWRGTALTSIVQVGIYLIAVVIVFANLAKSEEDFIKAWHGLLIVCVGVSILVIVKQDGFVLGLHKNGIGGSLATAFVITFALWLAETRAKMKRRYAVVASIILVACIITLSRGAWVAAMVGVITIFALRREFSKMIRIGLLLIPVVVLCWFSLPEEDREYAAGFEAKRENIRLRYESIDMAIAWFKEDPILGKGTGLRKEYDATNVALLSLAETGILGFATFIFIHFALIWMIWRNHKRVPKNSTAFKVLAIAGALVIGKLAHGMVDHYWSRGTLTVIWASAGAAVYVVYAERRRRKLAQLESFPETSLVRLPLNEQRPA